MKINVAVITGMLILVCALGIVGCAPEAETSAPANFYKGKTIDMVSTGTPGTTDDLQVRTVTSYLSRDTGAAVVVSDRHGAGGMDGMNYLYESEPDGLTLGEVSSNKFVANKVLDEPAAKYDIEKFSYIMGIGRRQTCFCVSPDGPYQSIADIKAGEDLKLGATSPSGYFSLADLTVIKLLELDATVITGFGVGDEIAAAVKRGELAGYASSTSGNLPRIEAGMVKPLFILARERDSLMPDVPAITELVSLSVEDLELVKLWERTLCSSTLLMAPPGIPEDKLEFLRDLAQKWMQDEEFREAIDAVSGEPVQTYISGEDVSRSMQDTMAEMDKFREIFVELIEKYRA